MAKYRHDFDLVASLTTEEEDFDKIPLNDLRKAFFRRLHSLTDAETREAIGHIVTEEDPA